MKQKPLEDITVKEVMSLADVNRATFYAHFSNIADLVNAIEEDVAAAVVQTAERLIGQSHNPADVADAIFTAIVRDTQIYDWLVSPNSTGRAKRLICEYARKHCLEGWASETRLDTAEANCLFDFLFEGCFGILGHWSGALDPEAKAKATNTLRRLIGATLTVLD